MGPISSTRTRSEDCSAALFNAPTPISSRDPKHPVDEEKWQEWFAPDGRPVISAEKMKQEIFRRGISVRGSTRKSIWPFLLGVHAWDITDDERQAQWEEKQ